MEMPLFPSPCHYILPLLTIVGSLSLLLANTHCPSFAAKATIAANAEPVPVSAACEWVWWKRWLRLHPTWPWEDPAVSPPDMYPTRVRGLYVDLGIAAGPH